MRPCNTDVRDALADYDDYCYDTDVPLPRGLLLS
jgi:hypothetical protein